MKKTEMVLMGMLIAVISIVACSSPSQRKAEKKLTDNTVKIHYDSRTDLVAVEEIAKINVHQRLYKVTTDGVIYLVVANKWSDGGTSIIRHEPKREQTSLNMDSVVNNSPWVPEYTMLGYTQAQPSSASIATLTNPEIRPVPIGSEDEFIKHHSYIPNDRDAKLVSYHLGKVGMSLVDIGGVL